MAPEKLTEFEGSRDAPREVDLDIGPIAVDAALCGTNTGIGLYATELLAALRRGPLSVPLLPIAPPRWASRTSWMVGKVAPMLRGLKASILHGIANFDLPLTKPAGMKYVLTVHDLIPLEVPGSVSLPYRLQFEVWLARCLSLADAVICVSEATAAKVRERYAGPVQVIHHGVDHVGRFGGGRRRGGGKMVLHVGTLEPRKNIVMLLRAFAAANLNDAELVLAGGQAYGAGPIVKEIDTLASAGVRLRWVGPLDRKSLERLMAEATALVAPSLAEGFGLPGLEAMALGVPVLASDIPAHREVLGSAARFVRPDDLQGFVDGLRMLSDNADLRAALSQQGRAHAARFTWDRAARATEAVYRSLL